MAPPLSTAMILFSQLLGVTRTEVRQQRDVTSAFDNNAKGLRSRDVFMRIFCASGTRKREEHRRAVQESERALTVRYPIRIAGT